ncbi:hypothetical protein [Anthocerotibacter panamensis]|uniref:hypothetical protein n=1 Tax=Anthocerotibacter panamensis TaxID=2857077 RepID=UPI001C404DF2|nr:hypothetical protein [Anthocerotibacter panamensis]
MLLGLGITALGTEVVGVVQDVGGFVTGSLDAKSTADLDRVAGHLARAIATVGVDTVLAVLTHKAGKAMKGEKSNAGQQESDLGHDSKQFEELSLFCKIGKTKMGFLAESFSWLEF